VNVDRNLKVQNVGNLSFGRGELFSFDNSICYALLLSSVGMCSKIIPFLEIYYSISTNIILFMRAFV
jgi:hypothetical protein